MLKTIAIVILAAAMIVGFIYMVKFAVKSIMIGINKARHMVASKRAAKKSIEKMLTEVIKSGNVKRIKLSDLDLF